MPQQIFPDWRDQNDTTKYPFAVASTLTNGEKFMVEGTLLDAALYPIGGLDQLYLSQVTVTHEQVTLYIGDQVTPLLAHGSFSIPPLGDNVALTDMFDRPAGLLASQVNRLSLFATWGIGTHTFTASQTLFAATVYFPSPEPCVRGVLLDDGTLLTGEVWLIGDNGVVLRKEVSATDPPYDIIRIDAVGDPLFRRRLCLPQDLFKTPQFLKTITFDDGRQIVTVAPDSYGNIAMTVNNDLAIDTVLRIHQRPDGNVFEAVGKSSPDQ